jgi:hypothetical protein
MIMIIKELALVFNIESESQLKNGDTEYFGSLTCGYLKTYCFLSKIQIETLKKDFKVEYDLKTNIEFKANFWTRSLALKENKYLNIGLI